MYSPNTRRKVVLGHRMVGLFLNDDWQILRSEELGMVFTVVKVIKNIGICIDHELEHSIIRYFDFSDGNKWKIKPFHTKNPVIYGWKLLNTIICDEFTADNIKEIYKNIENSY